MRRSLGMGDVKDILMMTEGEVINRLECHMCNQQPRFFIGPYLWCGDEDCRQEISELEEDVEVEEG